VYKKEEKSSKSLTRNFLGVLCVFNNKKKIYKEMTTASRLTTRTNEGGGRRQKPDTLQKKAVGYAVQQ
jgi:hypothetical protein